MNYCLGRLAQYVQRRQARAGRAPAQQAETALTSAAAGPAVGGGA